MTVAITDLTAALAKIGGGSLIADLLKQVDAAEAIAKKGNNVEVRKAAHRKALSEQNKVALATVMAEAEALVPRGQVIAGFSDAVMEGGLDEQQVVTAMEAFTGGKTVIEASTALNELIRQLVFRSMDLAAAAEGEEFPEHTAMVIDVPSTGKRFCREGVGRKPATIDLDALRAAVGDEVFNQITAEEVVVTRVIDEAALGAAVLDNPALLEQVREAVVPGDWKPARLMVRDIPSNEKE